MLISQFLDSSIYEYLFYRGDTFYTKYVPIGTLVAYTLMNIVGYAFVNIVTLKYVRNNPFLDSHGSYNSILKVIFIWSPVMWLCSAIFMLRGVNDTESFCNYYNDSLTILDE